MTGRLGSAVFAGLFLLVSATGTVVAGEHGGGHAGHEWGYEGEIGPEHWGDLKPEFALCETGTLQSPIDVATASAVTGASPVLVFDYRPVPLRVVNNGHTIQVNAPGGGITVDGARYDLVQFHFHTPSENFIDGKPFAGEMHLVHKSAEGRLAVVGVMLSAGSANESLERAWRVAPGEEGPERSVNNVTIDPAAVLPKAGAYFNWKGSLTTPPCSEGVEWFLMDKPLEVSASALAAIAKTLHGNARPPQALNGRTVIRVETKP